MRDLDELFAALGRSSFRRKFRLAGRDADYLARHGLEQVLAHGRQFIASRLAPAQPTDDGRQTPWAGHPAFVAQHATATCCRKCVEKWHGIPRGRPLEPAQVDYVLAVLGRWLSEQQNRVAAANQPAGRKPATQKQQRLFGRDV